MSESGSIVAETAARIFADLADPQEVNSAKDTAWKGRLWQALSEAGLTLAWVPEANGGAGAELADGFAILGVAGRYAAAAPLAETLLAGWLLSRAGLNAPDGAMSVAPARPGDKITLNADGTLSGQARGVPFAKEARHLAVPAASSVAQSRPSPPKARRSAMAANSAAIARCVSAWWPADMPTAIRGTRHRVRRCWWRALAPAPRGVSRWT